MVRSVSTDRPAARPAEQAAPAKADTAKAKAAGAAELLALDAQVSASDSFQPQTARPLADTNANTPPPPQLSESSLRQVLSKLETAANGVTSELKNQPMAQD